MTFRYDCANATSIAADACCISAVISECHIAYNTVSHIYYFYILGGVKFTYVVSTTRCIYTCPVSSGMRPRPPPSDLYYKTHEVTRCKQPLYIFFMLFFIKIKLSSRLCLTHKRVTQKYRKLHIDLKTKQKKTCTRIGLDRNWPILRIFWIGSDRIWKNSIVASLVITDHFILGTNPRVVNGRVKPFLENYCPYLSHIPYDIREQFKILYQCILWHL